MKNPISLQKTPAVLSVNFEEAREAIEQHVAKYNIVVTADTVGDAKKTATELNKQAKELDDRRKAAIAEVSAPIREADEQMKQLVTLYKDGRKKIIDQVERFEDETRAEAARKLEARREEVWDSLGVDDEFRAAEYRDLVRLTALTQAGNLAAGAKRDIDSRCKADKEMQDRTEKRLLQLENRSFRAGLTEPLTRDHVAHFLMEGDEAYEAGITRILAAEVERQKRIDEAARHRAKEESDREAQRQAEEEAKSAQEPVSSPEPAQPPAQDAPAPQAQPEAPPPAAEGKRSWRVHCRFDLVGIDPKITKEQIEGELRRVLETKAEITTLREINAVPQEGGS